MAVVEEVLGTFHGSDEFPIDWQEGEKELFWIFDDLHIPNPVSPMFFDIGGWWLTCDHMFRRFGTPFACDWIAKEINGYVYTAAVPCDPELHSEATEYQARYVPRVPRDADHAAKIGAYLGWVLPEYAGNFLAWWRDRLRPEIERNFAYLDGIDYEAASMREMAVYLEDAIDVHDRHWKIHWMLNFAQFASTTNLNAVIAEVRGGEDPGLMGRLQSSLEDRNWDSIEDLWKIKEEVKGDDELKAAFEGETATDVLDALTRSERGRRLISERIEAHQETFGNKAIWSHEFAFRTWREDPAPIIGAITGYLHSDYDYPSNIAVGPRRPRGGQARGDGGRRGRGAREAAAGARPVAEHEPAHPGPPLLRGPGDERAAAAGADRDRPQAGRRGRARGRRGRDVPPLQRAAAADGRPGRARRQGAGLRPPRRARGGGRAAAAVVGRHRHADRARLPLQRALGLPGEVPCR